jgi:hypothetical protein
MSKVANTPSHTSNTTSVNASTKRNSESRTTSNVNLNSQKNANNAVTTNASANEEMGKTSTSGVTLTIKVSSAKNIKGSKGEHVNSLVRVQFADFDFKDACFFMKKKFILLLISLQL